MLASFVPEMPTRPVETVVNHFQRDSGPCTIRPRVLASIDSVSNIETVVGYRPGILLHHINKGKIHAAENLRQSSANLLRIECDRTVSIRNTRGKVNNHQSKCLLINSQSLRDKTLKHRESIFDHDLEFLFITETWLYGDPSHGVHISELKPPGYDLVSFPRQCSRGGGIAIVYKNAVNVVTARPRDFQSFEWTEATVISQHGRFKFIVIYRPPPSTANKLFPSF